MLQQVLRIHHFIVYAIQRLKMGWNIATILLYPTVYMSLEFVLSEGIDCASYDLPNHDVDQYNLLAKKCSGSTKLGFKGSSVFYARFLSEANLNKLFENVEETRFEIRIEDTDLVEIKMPRLIRAQRPQNKRLFVIRANTNLKSVEIPPSAFDVQEPFHVEIDGNPELDDGILDRFQENCEKAMGKKCDIFRASPNECDMLDLEEIDVVADTCSGEKIIKQKPKSFVTLMASGLTEERFNHLFKEATHVQLCIKIKGTKFKTIRMPKLKRMFPCKERSESLIIENNPDLETVTLGSKETSIVNMHVKNNPKMRASSVSRLKNICSKLEKSKCEIDDTGVTGVFEDEEEHLQTTETTQTTHMEESGGRSTVLSEGLGGGDEDREEGYFADEAQLHMFLRDGKYGVHRKVEENGNESQMLCSYSFYIVFCALTLS